MAQQKDAVRKKYKYAFYSFVLFMFIFILGSVAFIFSMREIQYANMGRELCQLLEHEKFRLEAAVNGEISLVLKMAESPLVKRHFLNPGDPELEKIALAEFAGYSRILIPKSIFWINDLDKKFYLNDSYAYTLNPDAPHNYWYNMTINASEEFNFNINHNPDLNLINFWINAPVHDSNHKPIGIVGTGIDVSAFIDTVYRNYSGNSSLFFFNRAGEITGALDKNLVANKVHLESEFGKIGDIILSVQKELDGNKAQYFNIPGGIGALGAIPEFDWYVYTGMPMSLNDMLKNSLTVLFAAMMLVVAGIFVIFNLMQSNFELNKERDIYKDMSIVDPLTGIYNRRFLEESLERIIKSLSRSGGKLSLMILDVDYFKNYNDTYGHKMGDTCLKMLANTFTKSIVRADDFVARYGGEEFVIVLPNVDENGANIVAERVLNNVHEQHIPHGKSDASEYVTVSIGVVTNDVIHSHTGDDYIKKADFALYESKQNGRDRYTAADDIIS